MGHRPEETEVQTVEGWGMFGLTSYNETAMASVSRFCLGVQMFEPASVRNYGS